MGKDLYKILEVSPTASQSEIKKAYKRMAKILHPDAHRGSLEFEEKFKQLSNAYQILKNPKSRQSYDSTQFNNYSQSNRRKAEESPKKNRKSSSDFWTADKKEKTNSANSENSSDTRGESEYAKAESQQSGKEQRIYREPWGGFEPSTILKSIVALTLITMFGIGIRHERAQFARPKNPDVSAQKPTIDKIPTSGKTPSTQTKNANYLQKNTYDIPVEKNGYETEPQYDQSQSPTEHSASDSENSEKSSVQNRKALSQNATSLEEIALFNDLIACVQQETHQNCYDLATTAIETFVDRSRLGTAYFLQFFSAYNIEKSDASLDLFFAMEERHSQGQIHIDPLYQAQAYRTALHLTVILNSKANYYAIRDLAITHTDSYPEYAEQVDDIIKTADAKNWPSQ